MRVLAISGSLRRSSYNTALLRAAALELPPGTQFELFGELATVAPYCEDDDGDIAPPGVVALRTAIAQADAVVIATPEYNHSVPGQLKNALDWASRPLEHNPLRNKPAAVISTSTGMFGAVWSQAATRKVLALLGARVLDEELPVARARDAFDTQGHLRDPEIEQRLREIWDALLAEVPRVDRAA